MDTIKIQAFPSNVLVRKISFTENLLTGQLRGEACILHYGISRQKQTPN